MEDREFNKCNRECKEYLKTKYGKRINKEFIWILENIFRKGYELGKHDTKGKEKVRGDGK